MWGERPRRILDGLAKYKLISELRRSLNAKHRATAEENQGRAGELGA